jgi:four helix bundle protein
VRDFRQLEVWKKAHHLALEVYRATLRFPKEELYALTSQMRRSAVSIPANIAEGCGRDGKAELTRYLRIAMGSASELEYQFLLARDLKLLLPAEHPGIERQVIEVKRMLTGLIKKLTANR